MLAYADTGPHDGPVVLLIHHWPNDTWPWNGVALALTLRSPRVMVATLCDCRDTRMSR